MKSYDTHPQIIRDEIGFLEFKLARTIRNMIKKLKDDNKETDMELHNSSVEMFRSKYPDIYIEVDHFNKCVNFKKNIPGLTEQEKLRVKVGFDLQIEQVGSNNGTFVMDCLNVAKTYMTENTSPSKTLLYD
jgi:hypothetical protein